MLSYANTSLQQSPSWNHSSNILPTVLRVCALQQRFARSDWAHNNTYTFTHLTRQKMLFGFFKYSNDLLNSLCLCSKHTAWCSPASCVNKFWHLSSFLIGFHVRVTVCNVSYWAHGNLGMRPGSRSCLWQKSGWNELMLAESMRVLTFPRSGNIQDFFEKHKKIQEIRDFTHKTRVAWQMPKILTPVSFC